MKGYLSLGLIIGFLVSVLSGCGGSGGQSAPPPPPADFAFDIYQPTGSVPAGTSVSETVEIRPVNNFNSGITFSLVNPPSGFSASGSSTAGNTVTSLSITVAQSTAVGSYPLTIQASGGSLTRQITFNLSVTPTTNPDFSMSAGEALPGYSTYVSVNFSPLNQYRGAPTLTLKDAPSGITLDPTSTANAPATLSVASSVTPGTYALTMQASDGTLTHSAPLTLTVDQPPNTDVYIAGNAVSNGVANVIYWINGVAHVIPNAGMDNRPGALAVANGKVYVAGGQIDPNTQKPTATYWVDGVAVPLTDGTVDSQASAIAVDGADVYVCGSITTTPGGSSQAVYWKNGVMVSLAGGQYTSGIAVSGSTVAVGGMKAHDLSSDHFQTYWVNGVPHDVDGTGVYLDGPYADTMAIAIVGSDIYLSGKGGTLTSNGTAVVWKNGAVALSFGIISGPEAAASLFVDGSQFYIAGASDLYAEYYSSSHGFVDLVGPNEIVESYPGGQIVAFRGSTTDVVTLHQAATT